jgi:hypothetical protein
MNKTTRSKYTFMGRQAFKASSKGGRFEVEVERSWKGKERK